MLVWSPYHTIIDSKRNVNIVFDWKYLVHLLWFLFFFLLFDTKDQIHLTVCVSPSTVDEYIAIAKEKHGYNVEQVSYTAADFSFKCAAKFN